MAASADKDRRRLYERLGVKNISTTQMCEYVSEAHAFESFDPAKCTRVQLIQHAKYLYQAMWTPSDFTDLWFLTSNNQHSRGSKLYLPISSANKLLTARVNRQLVTKFPVLHDNYLQDRSDRWLSYLTTNLRLAKISRLTTPSRNVTEETFLLSDEFKYLFRELPASNVLNVLNKNWQSYSKSLEPDTSETLNPSIDEMKLKQEIMDTKVRSRIGPVSLSKCILPGVDIFLEEHIKLPILDVENVSDERFCQRLRFLGVQIEKTVAYFGRCLQFLKERCEPSHEILSHIYEQLQIRYEDNEDIIL